MRLLSSMAIAFATYSRIPMPRVAWTDENRRYSMCFFPLVGVVIGALLVFWLWLCEHLAIGPCLKGVIGALLPIWVTGGIHMDGFMDTTDALSSWQTKERRLEILKDSHVGAFAVMACAGYLLATAGLMSEASLKDAPLLGMVYVASRAMSAWALTVFQSARPQGMLDGFARAAQKRAVQAACAAYLVGCVLVWAALGGWLALPCAAASALCLAGYRHMAYERFGGITGDLAGWFVQVAEVAGIAVIMLGGKVL